MNDSIEWIGFAAATLTTVAFLPQVLRTWRLGGHELSWGMLTRFGTGVALWLVYGVQRASLPLIAANGLTLLQVLAIAAIKFQAMTRDPR